MVAQERPPSLPRRERVKTPRYPMRIGFRDTQALIATAMNKIKNGAARAESIELSSFIDKGRGFKKEKVEADIEAVKRRRAQVEKKIQGLSPSRRRFEEQASNVSSILEQMIIDRVQEIFGPSADAYRTSEFDERFRGTDIVVVFRDEEKNAIAYLAIDVTFANLPIMQEKHVRNLVKTKSWAQTTLEYFYDPVLQRHRKLFNTPHIILGVDAPHIMNLADQWMANQPLSGAATRALITMAIDQLRLLMEESEKPTSIIPVRGAPHPRKKLISLIDLLEAKFTTLVDVPESDDAYDPREDYIASILKDLTTKSTSLGEFMVQIAEAKRAAYAETRQKKKE